jgi:CPA1 family monovalent cation:H+ antiporter
MSAIQLGFILVVACIVAIVSRRLRLPYSVGLVAAGVCLALMGGPMQFAVTPDLVYAGLLPPLIFEAALQLKWRPFRADLPVTATLAFPGVLITGAVTAAGMTLIAGWGWLGSALFGALIAATDPVSVVAAFKETQVQPRLSLLVESESLLNDGAAAVAFATLVAISHGASMHVGAVVGSLIWMVFGGLAIGVLTAGAALLVAGRTQDHLVEITLTTIAAYGSFLLAEHLHMSGVLSAMAAGLTIGNVGWTGWMGCSISPAGRDHVLSFWEFAAFLANSIVFILIGAYEASQANRLFTAAAALAIGLVLLGRAVAIYPLCVLFTGTRAKVDLRYQHVLIWGGMRGALALALALAIPESVPEKGGIVVAAFAVVAFSIFAQGLTMPWLIKALGLTGKAAGRLDAPTIH